MFMSPPEMSEMQELMHECISFFMEEKMEKPTVASSGYKTTKGTTFREGGQTYSV